VVFHLDLSWPFRASVLPILQQHGDPLGLASGPLVGVAYDLESGTRFFH
jgi:hypothetical protein